MPNMNRPNRNRIGNPRITVTVTQADIDEAKCANRAQCVIARAIDRTFRLHGTGYIRVDANQAGVTVGDTRFVHVTPRPALRYVQRFDEIGEREGEDAARAKTKPRTFTFELFKTVPINQPSSPERKARINELRNERNAKRRAMGIYDRPRPRYVGV
jgi:hypothetical protein